MNAQPEIRLQDLVTYFFANKRFVILSTILSTAIAIAISLVITPVYTSSVTLVPVEENETSAGLLGQLGGLADMAGLNMSSSSNSIEVMIAEVSSREFAESFIETNNLYGKLFPELWDQENSTWAKEAIPPSPWSIQRKFRQSYSIVQDKKTGLVFLTVNWGDPKTAASVANGLIEAYENSSRQEAIEETERRIGYLEAEMNRTELLEVKTALFNLIETESKTKMLANTADRLKFKIIDPAYEPEFRSWPARKFITFLGLLIGFLAGMIFVLIKFLFLSKPD